MRHFRNFLLAAFFAAVPLAGFGADDLLSQAKRQIDNGDAQSAYDLLIPLQTERAGDPEYDFLLGSAALELGRNTEAVFALERVLAVKPDNAPARQKIAVAYFRLKETETAKREFENVRKQDIPPEVALTIDRFLDQITRIEDTKRVSIRGFIEVGGGYDSNVNSATADSQIAVPLLGGAILALSPSSQEQSDSYAVFSGGLNLRAPMTKAFSIFGGFSFLKKMNWEQNEFSTDSYDLSAGASYQFDRDIFTLAARYNQFFVDNKALYQTSYRNAIGGTANWQHDFNARNQVSAFVQRTELTYPGQGPRDANRDVGGLGYAFATRSGVAVFYLGGYGGQEKEKDANFPQFGHDLYGARLGGQAFFSEKYSVFLNASAEHREYHGTDPFFLVTRKDDQYYGSVGLHFVPRKNMRITPQASYMQNNSNIELNQFDRWMFQLTLRQDI